MQTVSTAARSANLVEHTQLSFLHSEMRCRRQNCMQRLLPRFEISVMGCRVRGVLFDHRDLHLRDQL